MHQKTAALVLVLGVSSPAAFASRTTRDVPRRAVYGRVIDAGTGKPIERVPVIVAGETIGALTNANGAYTLSGVPGNRSRIEFRHPCYFAVQVSISNDVDVELDIGLPFDQSSLQRPGCGGLGARTRRDTAR